MKRKTKKIFAALLTVTMAISMVACGDTETVNSSKSASDSGTKVSTAETPESASSAEEKDYSEHFTYSYASIQITESTNYNSADDAMTQYWQQKYNFDWDVISISSDNWDSTVSTWVYAEDLPDVTIFDYKHAQMMDWIDQGLVFEFPEGWEERWPNVAASQVYAGLEPAVREIVGSTYFLARPNYSNNKPTSPDISPTNMMIYIRKDWAEAVGFELKDYYTIDEIMEYAELVKDKDPGNVGKDLVPMGLSAANCYNLFVRNSSTYTASDYYFYQD